MSVARAADFMPGPTVTLLGLLNKGRRRIELTAWALLFFVRNPFILLDGAVIHMLLLVDQAEAGDEGGRSESSYSLRRRRWRQQGLFFDVIGFLH